jgi:fatty acyl-CoA reductase
MIEIIESMSPEEIEKNAMKILQKHNLPNTYSFTKCLAEALVVEAREKHNLPAIIFRPSIVVSTWRDPVPGYIDNLYGPIGMMLAVGKGAARAMYCDQKSYGDFLPCDIAINGVFICVWNFINFR